MKAVSCHRATLSVVDIPTPGPNRGQLLLDVVRCGICGSDLHARDHIDELTEAMSALGVKHAAGSDMPFVFGHEFCGEVAERGRGVSGRFKPGSRVVSFPLLRDRNGVHMTGLSPAAPGAYAEQVLAEAALSFVVPNGLSPDIAALTEPMAVALHAVRRSDISRRDTAIVVGCGPVGLAIVCHEPFESPSAVHVPVQRGSGHTEPGGDGVEAQLLHAERATDPDDVVEVDLARASAQLSHPIPSPEALKLYPIT
ncbi:hypothetical protein RDE2_24430 [Rhodococcus sp. RDE2]|nr:hypothetical protein RDE2_24430 [Rhodococcus sp. RDE2]